MNHIETWFVRDIGDVEEKVNRYCETNKLNPISISVTYVPIGGCFAAVVVEEKED